MEPCEGVDGIMGPSYGPSLRGRQDSNFLGTGVPILLWFKYSSKYFFGSPHIITGSLADDAGGPEAGPETRPHLVPGQEAEQLGGQVSLASQQGQVLR